MDKDTARLLLARLLHALPKGRWWLLRPKEDLERVQRELLALEYSSSCLRISTARAGRKRVQLELVARKYSLSCSLASAAQAVCLRVQLADHKRVQLELLASGYSVS